ncbi:MarR family transcriptional regulator [Prosthecobacter sp. SYSU 5D2]|uniref:MarR family winged helix-turn-helix transcriptional regulator n=1 Tax=Prosthecobacter sp. SYSU 5D2 TaxID=3134134 RepID=UPI0031FEF112
MSKTSVSQLEDHLGYWFRCLSNFVSESFASRLAGHDISVAQWVVLRTLYDREELTLNEAAALVGVDKSSLSRMMDRLEARGLVQRTAGADRRSIGLNLTTAARKLVPQLAELADQNDRQFFKPLPATRRKELLQTLQFLLKENGWELPARGNDRLK